jgi:hypothetical protein
VELVDTYSLISNYLDQLPAIANILQVYQLVGVLGLLVDALVVIVQPVQWV